MSIFLKDNDEVPEEYQNMNKPEHSSIMESDIRALYFTLKAIADWDNGDAKDFYDSPQDLSQQTMKSLSKAIHDTLSA